MVCVSSSVWFCFSPRFWNLTILLWKMTFHGLCHLMDKSAPFPKPDLCRRRNSRLPLNILQLVWKLFLTKKYLTFLCATPHLKASAKVSSLLSFLLSVSWQIWWITQSSSEMWPFVVISTMARWEWENFQRLGTGFLLVPAHFSVLRVTGWGFEAVRLHLLTLGGLCAYYETRSWNSSSAWVTDGACS